MVRRLLVASLLAALLPRAPRAQDRPSEDELFGAPAAPPPEQRPAPPAPGQPRAPAQAGPSGPQHGETEAELFGSKDQPPAPAPPATGLISREREDWLKIGGQLQLRAQVTAYQDTAPGDWPFVSPDLLDLYLDARPNDRVRAFALGRMSYDPTVSSAPGRADLSTPGSGGGGGISATGVSTGSTSNPSGLLDQLWVNYDVEHRAFVTAGRQHVKWGVGRFWNPTDYLHPVKRDPLATFDVRTGSTMLKLHLPWEKRGWNFYGMALLEDVGGNTVRTASRLGRIGAGGRAELVLWDAELGLDAVVQEGHRPRFGVDLSRGLGPFDLYAEAALRSGGDGPRWRRTSAPAPGPLSTLAGWFPDDRQRLTPQVVLGGSWSANVSDQDSITLGAEYFYNDLGYEGSAAYPFLLLGAPAISGTTFVQQDPRAFQPFYLGRHYAGLSLLAPKPGRWNDTTLVLSALANLSDRTGVVRLDASVLVLTYLTVEAFVAGHLGPRGGEFRLALPADLAALAGAQGGSSFPSGAPLVDAGVALRVSL